MKDTQAIKSMVKDKYGEIAAKSTGCCSGSSCCGEPSMVKGDYNTQNGYYKDADLKLGCGIPTEFANIREGAKVLDLGSGAGNDVFIARRLVGNSGKVIGVDMTQEMDALARKNNEKLGYTNVEFRLGDIENMPVKDGEVDTIISNCVLNLVPDKEKAFSEMYRVLEPGGHFCVSDIVMDGELPPKLKQAAEAYAGCISGAVSMDKYMSLINKAGFKDIEIKAKHTIDLSDEFLRQYATVEEVAAYRQSGAVLRSITVYGVKPPATQAGNN